MNIYFTTGLIVALVLSWAGCAYMGYNYEHAQCSVHDEAHDLAQTQITGKALEHKAGVVATQGNISQEASSDYAKDFTSISSAYSDGVQLTPAPTLDSVPAVRSAPVGACTNSVPPKSKVYHLTPQQCDTEEAKCNALWNWAQAQAAVK